MGIQHQRTVAGLSSTFAPRDTLANTALRAVGATVVLGGDSITDGAGATNASVDSYRAYLGKILGTSRVDIVNGGVSGNTAAQLLARVPALLSDNDPVAAFVLQIGTNASTSLTQYKADVTAILDLLQAAAVPAVINLLPPRGSATSSEQERTHTYNLWLRHVAYQRGIPLVDLPLALIDTATGLLAAAYDSDGTHPTPAGHLVIAQQVATVLGNLLPTRPPIVSAAGAPGLIANPLMAGGGVSTPPTGWSSTGVTGGGTGSVGTVAKSGLCTSGDWMQITADATAVGSTVTVGRYANLSTAPSAGDVIMVAATVEQDSGSENAAVIQWADGSTVISIPLQTAGVAAPGRILRTYTVSDPAPANPRIRCITSAAAGTARTVRFGQVQVWNLTALGLTDIA